MFLLTSSQSGARQTTNLKSRNISFKIYADQPDHVPSTGASNNRAVQYLGNTAGRVGLPI